MNKPAWMVVGAVVLVASSGVPGIFLDRRSRAGERIAVAAMAAGAVLGLAGASIAAFAEPPPAIDLPWPVPGGAFSVAVDTISALFLAPGFFVGLLGSIYGLEYWAQSAHPENGRKLRLFYGVLVGSLALVVIARNTILFLGAWEVMAVAAFFLITTEDEDPKVRETGLLYLVLTHVGTLSLFAMFALLHGATGGFDFAIAPGAAPSLAVARAIFFLAITGFGIKAGLMPLHVWLPSAHANAPSHVSALMSGVLIKMGIYGLVRVTSLFPAPPGWWGTTLLVAGRRVGRAWRRIRNRAARHQAAARIPQRREHRHHRDGARPRGDRALVGIARSWSLLGIAGALFHTWNHGLFKALLFLSAGSRHPCDGDARDRSHGGPRKGDAAHCARFSRRRRRDLRAAAAQRLRQRATSFTSASSTPSRAPVATRGWRARSARLRSRLSAPSRVACFVKAFGAVFLGAPRSPATGACARVGARDASGRWARSSRRVRCSGFAPLVVAPLFDRAAAAWAPEIAPHLAPLAAITSLGWIGASAVLLVGTIVPLRG